MPAELPPLGAIKMTAEIALLNRRALAFAADSAVTISDGTSTKIYNSAEKIFELSRITPIGLMIYNGMEFVGVPLDVLIRQFRCDCDRDFTSCDDACTAFLSYLCDFERNNDDECEHLSFIIADEMVGIVREYQSKLREELFAQISNQKNKSKFYDLAKKIVCKVFDDHYELHNSRPLKGFLEGTTIEDFIKVFGKVIDAHVSIHFKEFRDDKELRKHVEAWTFAVLKSDIFI